MITFNICFIKQGNNILLLNREKPSWMGCWNGIGGKLEPGEQPRASMIRELSEETGITSYELSYKGLVTWTSDGARFGGMYLYCAELAEEFDYPTPVKTAEGILDWKAIGWILHPENVGISSNIPIFLHRLLEEDQPYEHHCKYEKRNLVHHSSVAISPATEHLDETLSYIMTGQHTYSGE